MDECQRFTPLCSLHKEQEIIAFCGAHHVLLCNKCTNRDHDECSPLLSLNEASARLNRSSAITDFELKLENLDLNFKKGLQVYDDVSTDVQGQKEKIRQEIEEVREQLNDQLDRLKDKLLSDVDSNVEEYKKKCDEKRSGLIDKTAQISGLKDQIRTMKSSVSDLEFFIQMKQLEKEMDFEKKELIKTLDEIERISLSLNISSKIRSMQNNLKTFGKVEFESKPAKIKYIEIESEQVQGTISGPRGFAKETLQLRINFILNTGPLNLKVDNCVILPNNLLVFADSANGRLVIHKENGQFSRNIRGLDNVNDVTIVNDAVVAVTFGGPRQKIGIVNVLNNRIDRKLLGCIQHECHGISYYDGNLYVIAYTEGIKVISLQGQIVNIIQIDFSFVTRIVAYANRLYYVDNGTRDVICCDISGDRIWIFKDERGVISPYNDALTVDNQGNLIVATVDGLIFIISIDGQKGKILNYNKSNGQIKRSACYRTSKAEVVDEPTAVYCDRQNKLLLICGKGGHARLIDII